MKTYTLFSNNALSSDEADLHLSDLVINGHEYLIAESRIASVREKSGNFFSDVSVCMGVCVSGKSGGVLFFETAGNPVRH